MGPWIRPLAAGLAFVALTSVTPAPSRPRVPALVFVSRNPVRQEPRVVPGLGLHGRLVTTGGRLLVREATGRVRPLLPEGALYDVSDPCVSWDAKWIAFAGTPASDAPWRIYVVGADGRGVRVVTPEPLGVLRRVDDFDPCWLPDGRIVFASTRWPERAQLGRIPATNLYAIRTDGTGLVRVTTERNAAGEPTVDAAGRIVYGRWFFNRWLASDVAPGGATADPKLAVEPPSVNQWQVVSILPDGGMIRLAGGDPRTRPSSAGDQPAVLANGDVLAVRGDVLAAEQFSNRFVVQRFKGGVGEASIAAGFGVRCESACAPAALPGGGAVLAVDAEGRGDYGLAALGEDGALRTLYDAPGTLELDPAPLVARRTPPVIGELRGRPMEERPPTTIEEVTPTSRSFRFDCMNVFAQGPVDGPWPNAVPMQRGVRIRFYSTLSRPDRVGGDTLVLFREIPVQPDGSVHVEDVPGDSPGFEQLVGADGKVLRSALGPAHVPGSNFAIAGSGTQCAGCHAGHSALPVPGSYSAAKWTNAAPSAEVRVVAAYGAREANGVTDRRTFGDPERIGWVSGDPAGEKLQLRWRYPIEVREIVLYPLHADRVRGTDLRVSECEIAFFDGEQEVERTLLREPLSPLGTRATCKKARVDRLEIRLLRWDGRVLGRQAAGLAEVETIARLIED